MIERGPRTQARMTYDEALVYCAFLEHNGCRGWRLPRQEEIDGHELFCWHLNDDSDHSRAWAVIPVRDIVD
jgi:hypothetical protein